MISLEFLILELITILIFIVSLKKNLLTLGGAFSALIVGSIISLSGFEYYVILASFFISSTKATNLHKKIKTKLLGESYLKDKKRNAIQVLCKSLFPSIVCLIIYQYYGKENEKEKGMSFFNQLYLNYPSTYNYNYKYKLFLDAFFIGFFESANADTWASELGILSRQSPILILKGFQHVPKGINGAISKYGTICSIFGGLFISIIAIICNIFRYGIKNYFINFNIPLLSIGIKLLLCGGFIGFIGSLIDSILGQTIQLTIYNVTKQCVIEKEQVENAIKNGDKLKYYGKDILNNSGINLVTGLITALISGYLGVILF